MFEKTLRQDSQAFIIWLSANYVGKCLRILLAKSTSKIHLFVHSLIHAFKQAVIHLFKKYLICKYLS